MSGDSYLSPVGIPNPWHPPRPGRPGESFIDGLGNVWIADANGTWCLQHSFPFAPPIMAVNQMPPLMIGHPAGSIITAANPITPQMMLPYKLRRPDPKAPNTLGWRAWYWLEKDKVLMSPCMGTLWETRVLTAPNWSKVNAVRNEAGIHALLVRRHWKLTGWFDDSVGVSDPSRLVHGIVERFGRFVLGTEGWRAEQVKILELMAPSTEIGLQLEQKYPGVIIHYPDQEEDEEWTLEKSSRSAKGKRSLISAPSPSPSTSPVSPSIPPDPLLIASLLNTKKKGSPLGMGLAIMFGALAGWCAVAVLAVIRIVHGG